MTLRLRWSFVRRPPRREHRRVQVGRVDCGSVSEQFLPQPRGHVDLPHPPPGLRAAHVDLAVREVEIRPAQVAGLSVACPTRSQESDHGAARARAPDRSAAVEPDDAGLAALHALGDLLPRETFVVAKPSDLFGGARSLRLHRVVHDLAGNEKTQNLVRLEVVARRALRDLDAQAAVVGVDLRPRGPGYATVPTRSLLRRQDGSRTGEARRSLFGA
jgi:hypothetical protein